MKRRKISSSFYTMKFRNYNALAYKDFSWLYLQDIYSNIPSQRAEMFWGIGDGNLEGYPYIKDTYWDINLIYELL